MPESPAKLRRKRSAFWPARFPRPGHFAAAKAQFMESINDELGLVAALIGTLFIIWNKPIADPVASIVVATIIAYNGLKLFRENWNLLLGRSPGTEYLERIQATALSVPG